MSCSPFPIATIRAMANYLASLNGGTEPAVAAAQSEAAIAASETAKSTAALLSPKGERIFNGACATCHTGNTILPSLALNSNLHADTPDNILQVILHGVEAPAILAKNQRTRSAGSHVHARVRRYVERGPDQGSRSLSEGAFCAGKTGMDRYGRRHAARNGGEPLKERATCSSLKPASPHAGLFESEGIFVSGSARHAVSNARIAS